MPAAYRTMTELRRELEVLLRTRCPAVVMVTWEEARTLRLVRDISRVMSPAREFYVWSAGSGLRLEGQPVPGLPSPCSFREALAASSDHKTASIFCFLDADLEDPVNARMVRDLMSSPTAALRSLVFVSPDVRLHATLSRLVAALEVPVPDKGELRGLLSAVAHRCASLVGVEIQLDGDAPDRLAEAARGLTAEEAERAFIRCLMQVQRLSLKEVPLVLAEKRRILDRDPLVTSVVASDTLEDLGGLDVLKAYLSRRGRVFSDAAAQSGLPSPRGILLVGMGGCGRGHAIRAAAAAWELPLLRLELHRLDPTRVLSAERFISLVRRLEAMAPCVLFIPGIDRIFARGSESEGGRAETPLSLAVENWLVERDVPVYVAATAEDHERLPLELLWKRAFDDVFFVDFPTSEERRQILVTRLKRRNMLTQEMSLEMLVAASEGFSGVQIESAIIRGATEAFEQNRPIRMVDILQSLRQMTPMAGFLGEPRRRLRAWAHRRAQAATTVKEP